MQTTQITSTMEGISRASCTPEMLVELAKFSDDRARALSFYFDASNPADTSHRQELLNVKHLIDDVSSNVTVDAEVSDLNLIRSIATDITMKPRVFRALFLCGRGGIRTQIDLPVACDIGLLKAGRRFELVPLLRALEACTPYGVILVESGKARAFSAQGDEIHEWKNVLPTADVGIHAEGHHGYWPNHIDANAEARAKRFLRDLASSVHQFALDHGLEHIVLGCREGQLGKLEPEFARIGMNQIGSFHITSFSATPYEVLQQAKTVFKDLQEQSYAAFWRQLSETPERSATGSGNVLQRLQQGRVGQLFLNNTLFGEIVECGNCGRSLPVQQVECGICNSSRLYRTRVDEWMVRKALQTGAEITAVQSERMYGQDAVGALLRY